jgi:hypothetical protein
MLSDQIPLFISLAIDHGACVLLPGGDGWQVWAEPAPCPSCQQMRALYILRQGEDLKFRCGCIECDDVDTTGAFMKAISRWMESHRVGGAA